MLVRLLSSEFHFPQLPYLYKILPICKRWFGLLQVCTQTWNSAVLNGIPSTEIKQESIFFNSDKGLRILFHLVQIFVFHYLGVSKRICNQLLVDRSEIYRGADKSLAWPTSQCILFDGENISFDASLVIYINSTNIPPIMIIDRIYENQNLLSQ
jgi:hypothetical protein